MSMDVSMDKAINLKPIKVRRISAERYIKLSAREKDNIERARFVPPRIGSRGFGFFELVLKRCVYKKR